MGLSRAGFEVVGVDIAPQPHYPFEFHQADALEFPLEGFDLIWASPPCQAFTVARQFHKKEAPDLIDAVRCRLRGSAASWVIENVPEAPLRNAVMLCGKMFGLKVFRHRRFETSPFVLVPPHHGHGSDRIGEGFYMVVGHTTGRQGAEMWGRRVNNGTVADWREAMGIDWMTRHELTQAIPPAYSQFLATRIKNQMSGLPLATVVRSGGSLGWELRS